MLRSLAIKASLSVGSAIGYKVFTLHLVKSEGSISASKSLFFNAVSGRVAGVVEQALKLIQIIAIKL